MFPKVLTKRLRARCCVPRGFAYQLVIIPVFGAHVLDIVTPQNLTRLPLASLRTLPMPQHHYQHMLLTMLYQVLSPRLLDLVYQLQDLEQDRVPDRTPTHPNLPLPVVWQLVLKQMLGLSSSTKPGRYLPLSHPCKHSPPNLHKTWICYVALSEDLTSYEKPLKAYNLLPTTEQAVSLWRCVQSHSHTIV